MSRYGADRRWPFAEGGGTTIGLATGFWSACLMLWRRRQSTITGLLAAGAGAVWLLVLYFFRDPNRHPPRQPGLVLSPGDGEVVAIVEEEEGQFLRQRLLRISIFLSIFDVHVQRVPLGGQVTEIVHRPGQFLQAFRPEASEENEAIAMELATPYGTLLVRQVAGIMARRCVNYLKAGDVVETGQRFGLIRFGSRVDLFLPATAEILVTIGASVKGGITPVARLGE